MSYRVLILGAGGPAGANVIRSLKAAGHYVIAHDEKREHLPWAHQAGATAVATGDAMETARNVDGVDLIYAQPDPLVWQLSEFDDLPTFLPAMSVIWDCQDKWATAYLWAKAGLRSRVEPLPTGAVCLDAPEQTFGYPYWLRLARGAGARGATKIESKDQAEAWLGYWQSQGCWDFIAEEYLPGRDYAVTTIWRDGKLVVSQARERLEYIYPHLSPSGRTGTPTIARTIRDDRITDMALRAIRTVDEEPHGIYSVDLREDKDGRPRPTEINPGRFFTTIHFFTEAGLNLPDLYVRLHMGEEGAWDGAPRIDPLPASLYWVRHIDCPAQLLTREEAERWFGKQPVPMAA